MAISTVHTVSGNIDGETDIYGKQPNSSLGRRCFNPSFIKTPLGILQIVATVINVICIGIMGDVVTTRMPGQSYWLVAGFSYMTFFVMLAFMCLTITTLIVLTSVTSSGTSTLLPKTTFFLGYHILATVFYLCTSIAVLSEASKYSELYALKPGTIGTAQSSIRGQVLAAGSFGVFATVVYTALTIFAIYHYMRS